MGPENSDDFEGLILHRHFYGGLEGFHWESGQGIGRKGPGKGEAGWKKQGSHATGNSDYTFHGLEKSLNITEIAKIREKIRNVIAGQGSFVVPNLFGY